MFIDLVRKTKFAACLIFILLSMLVPAALAQETANNSDQADQVFVHLDLVKLAQSQTGKVLVDSLYKIPYVHKQLNSIPDNLLFLKNARCESITLQVSGSHQQQTAVLEVACELDQQKLFDLLTHANGYAKVQSSGIDIHHWVTDFETLGNQFMGQAEKPWADNKPDSVYLAMPTEGRFLVSTSLARLTEKLADTDRSQSSKPAVFDQFEQGNDLISLHVAVAGDDLPGELSAVVREEESGRLRIHASLKSRNEAEKQIATMIDSLLKNPRAITQMFAVVPNPDHANVETQTGKKSKSIELHAETTSADLKHANKLSFGLQMNSASMEQDDWEGMIERFLLDCVQCEHQADTLTLHISMFLGPSRVRNVARDSEEGIASGLDFNVMQIFFNVYTTDEERQAAKRIAEKQADDLRRR